MVSTGSDTSGSSDTGSRPSDTAPSRTKPRVSATVVTGRLSAPDAIDIRPRSWLAVSFDLGRQPHRRIVGEREMPLDQHHVTGLERNLTGGAVGQHFGVQTIG